MIQAEAYFLCNAAFCFCALPLGGKLAGLPAPPLARLMKAAGMGGLAALFARFLPSSAAFALASLPICVWFCFGGRGMQACLRCVLTTLGASLLSGGAALWLLLSGASPQWAALGSAALCLTLYMLVTLLPGTMCEVRQVELSVGENSVLLPAMVDSGNLLRDPITSAPVLVAPMRAMRALFPDAETLCELGELPQGFRLLNVHTAAGGGLLPMFRPDRCRLYIGGRACDAELLVAVAGKEYGGVQALVPLAALPRNPISS